MAQGDVGIYASQISGHLAAPAFQGDYWALNTVTVPSGGVTSITISGIPQNFTNLQMRFNARSLDNDTNAFIYMQLNGDTSSNYSFHYLRGDGASPSVIGYAGQTVIYDTGQIPAIAASSNIFGVGIVDFLDYSRNDKYKTTRSLNGYDANGSGSVFIESGNWRVKEPITSIKLTTQSGSGFAQNSQFALYGVK